MSENTHPKPSLLTLPPELHIQILLHLPWHAHYPASIALPLWATFLQHQPALKAVRCTNPYAQFSISDPWPAAVTGKPNQITDATTLIASTPLLLSGEVDVEIAFGKPSSSATLSNEDQNQNQNQTAVEDGESGMRIQYRYPFTDLWLDITSSPLLRTDTIGWHQRVYNMTRAWFNSVTFDSVVVDEKEGDNKKEEDETRREGSGGSIGGLLSRLNSRDSRQARRLAKEKKARERRVMSIDKLRVAADKWIERPEGAGNSMKLWELAERMEDHVRRNRYWKGVRRCEITIVGVVEELCLLKVHARVWPWVNE